MKYKPLVEERITNLKEKHPERYAKILPQAIKKLYGVSGGISIETPPKEEPPQPTGKWKVLE